MNIIPEQNNLLEQIGSFMGSKIVDAAAVASAIVILRSGVRDPKIIGGAFALYAVAKKDGQLMGQLAGKSFDLYLKDTFNVDVDQYINKNINQINQIIDTYFDISKKHQTDDTPTTQTQTTIHEIASRLNTTISKLEQSNPWLKSRNSDNLSTIFSNSSNKSLLVKDNTGKSYTYTYNSSSDSFENQTPIATADDAINFIANFDGTMSDLQNIQNAVKDAYENNGLSKEYYDAFMESFNTYVKVNTQNNNVTTQPTGNSTRIDKNAFYYYNNINDTALSLANKTFRVLDSNNKAFSVQDLKLLDVNINLATKKILF